MLGRLMPRCQANLAGRARVHGNTGMDPNKPEWTPEQTRMDSGMDRNGPEWTGMDRNEPEWTVEWTGMDSGMDTGMDRNGHGNGPEWTPARTGMELKIR